MSVAMECKIFSGKNFFLLVFSLCVCSPSAFGIAGSITDPGFSEGRILKKSFFGPVYGSVKTRISRSIRRSEWGDFLSPDHAGNIFDTLFIKTDLSLNYPLVKSFPALEKSSSFNRMLLFFILSYRRPLYDTAEVIKWHCYKSYFCFGETSVGLSNGLPVLPWMNRLKGSYSVYLNLSLTSKKSYDRKKFVGIGSSLNLNYPLLSKTDLQISGISSHFFDTAIYGSRYTNEIGSGGNEIFSFFNQVGMRFSYSGKPFIPTVLVYINHLFSLDYLLTRFQGLSLGWSAVWSIGKRIQIVGGLSWGSAIFRYEFAEEAIEAEPFNPDETFFNGGFSYSF